MLIDISGKSKKELLDLLEKVKVSDADFEIKDKNIRNIQKAINGQDNHELLRQIEESQADIDDIN